MRSLQGEFSHEIHALNEKIMHPGVVHEQTLHHLVAVRTQIEDTKKDLAYKQQNLPEKLIFPKEAEAA